MDRVNTLEEINGYVHVIKNHQKGFLTNFFLDKSKHSYWISKGELYSMAYDKCIFLIRRSPLANYLFYFSTDVDSLRDGLGEISRLECPLVLDLVGTEQMTAPIKELFLKNKFTLYESLYRMSRTGLPLNQEKTCTDVLRACREDAEEVCQLLTDHFDPLSEQLPTLEEIRHFIEGNGILVYKNDDRVVGFIIYELLGITLYLRYWFVSPEFRELKIGSRLFEAFMYEGRNTKRQLFWVIASNENAIKRYEHYGFRAEELYDYVLIKK